MTTALLSSILEGREKTPSVLLQDSSQRNGRPLLKALALQCLERFPSCHVFLFDVHPLTWTRDIPPNPLQRLIIHDCFTDHLGWRSGSGPAPLHEATPTSFISGEGTLSDCMVVVDSLSALLDYHPPSHLCRLLHQIRRRCGLLVCLLHSDLHSHHVTSQVGHVISTTIDLTRLPTVAPQPSTTAGRLEVRVQHCRPSGKVLVSTELVAIDDSYVITSSPHITSSLLTPSRAAPDPTLNLTFDLTLSEREKEERRQLVLPYHHSPGKKTALLQAGSGMVFYQPDEADDYDDSDPDDDLDI